MDKAIYHKMIGKVMKTHFPLMLFVLIFLVSMNLFAYDKQFVITSILTDENISIQRLDNSVDVKFGDVLVIYSHDSNEVLGYAKVQSLTENSDFLVARVETHDRNGLIRQENYLKKIDLTKASSDIPGRFDLTVQSEGRVAAKFRPLVYTGLANGMTAANLNKGEFLLGPSVFSYGLNSFFQVDSNLISNMFKILNLGMKTKLYDSGDIVLSVENSFQYNHVKRRGSYLFTGYLDMTTNSSIKSYAKVKMFTKKPNDQYLYNSEEYSNDLNVELQLSYGLMLSSWNQIIFGPKVDVNKRRAGGFLGYYTLDTNVNTMFGVSANDFSEFELGKQSYLINFDIWWRF